MTFREDSNASLNLDILDSRTKKKQRVPAVHHFFSSIPGGGIHLCWVLWWCVSAAAPTLFLFSPVGAHLSSMMLATPYGVAW